MFNVLHHRREGTTQHSRASRAVDFPLSAGNDMEGILWTDNSASVWSTVDFRRITWY